MEATQFSIEGTNVVTKKALNNVVGVLAGKVNQMNNSVFSEAYDHLGVGSQQGQHDATDSIYNGANDDARYNSRNHVG
jgi:hypothetical protein